MVAPLIMALTPLISKLMENGLTLLGNAVMAKGKDVIETKLGVKLEDNLSPEMVLQLKHLEIEHEEYLIEASLKQRDQELKQQALDNENTASARDMNAKIQMSSEAHVFAKLAPYILDFVIIIATLALAFLLFTRAIPTENKEIANIAFGALLAMCGTILNFHRGTSSQSRTKDDTILHLSKEEK